MSASRKLNETDNVVEMKKYQDEKFNLHFALHDPIHCLAPGLFRSIKKGDRKKLKLDVVYTFGTGKDIKKIEFKGHEPLGADDLRVLQGLVALSGNNKNTDFVSPNPTSEAGIQIREKMKLKEDAIKEKVIIAKGSFRELAREIGYSDCENTKLIQKSIERLYTVTIFLESNKKRVGCHLLSMYGSDSKNGKLFVGLNPLITEVIFGERSHTRIDMSEVRTLKSDVARLIHQRICAWIDPGKSGNISIDTLIEYVWYEKTENIETTKKRKKYIRDSIKEFGKILWEVDEYKRGNFCFKRPKSIEVLGSVKLPAISTP